MITRASSEEPICAPLRRQSISLLTIAYQSSAARNPRQICLAVMEILFEFLTTRLAPILCFTAEEAFQSLRRKRGEDNKVKLQESIHLQGHRQARAKVQEAWKDKNLAQNWQGFLAADDWYAIVNSEIDWRRKGAQIGSSLEARIIFPCPEINTEINSWDNKLKSLGIDSSNEESVIKDILAEIFIVSDVVLDRESKASDMKLRVEEIRDWQKCERCWKLAPEVKKAVKKEESKNSSPANSPASSPASSPHSLCSRCARVVEQAKEQMKKEQDEAR